MNTKDYIEHCTNSIGNIRLKRLSEMAYKSFLLESPSVWEPFSRAEGSFFLVSIAETPEKECVIVDFCDSREQSFSFLFKSSNQALKFYNRLEKLSDKKELYIVDIYRLANHFPCEAAQDYFIEFPFDKINVESYDTNWKLPELSTDKPITEEYRTPEELTEPYIYTETYRETIEKELRAKILWGIWRTCETADKINEFRNDFGWDYPKFSKKENERINREDIARREGTPEEKEAKRARQMKLAYELAERNKKKMEANGTLHKT